MATRNFGIQLCAPIRRPREKWLVAYREPGSRLFSLVVRKKLLSMCCRVGKRGSWSNRRKQPRELHVFLVSGCLGKLLSKNQAFSTQPCSEVACCSSAEVSVICTDSRVGWIRGQLLEGHLPASPTPALLTRFHISRAPEEGSGLLQAPLKPPLPGLGRGWDQGSSWPQTYPRPPTTHPPEKQEAENQG